jgi:REP element-mobilizing transposase RayT
MRTLVERTIIEVAEHRGWTLHAVNVRTNHVHVVVTALKEPDRVMNDFKAYATRRLAEAGLVAKNAKVWSRHGSTRYLWTEKAVFDKCQYVRDEQGPDLPRGSDP